MHRGCVTCDASTGRVSVWVDEDNLIKEIEMEVAVDMWEDGCRCGADLNTALRKQKDD